VSKAGLAGHRVREARKILKKTSSRSVVVVSGRWSWSKNKVCPFARTLSAADTPPKSIMVMREPIIIPPNIFSMRTLLLLKRKLNENFFDFFGRSLPNMGKDFGKW
jgi:hypothetical protein